MAVLALSAGCDPVNKPTMNPGQDCLSCHCQGSPSCTASNLPWSAAGTVFARPDSAETDGVQGVRVMITDALGKEVTLHTNAVGNFYTAESLQPPLQVTVADNAGHQEEMATQPTPDMVYGSFSAGHGVGCNGCHAAPSPDTGLPPTPQGGGAGIAPLGRIYAPIP